MAKAKADAAKAAFLKHCGVDGRDIYRRDDGGRTDIFMRTQYRMFAAWIDTGAQRGAHVRSTDASLPKSTAFRGEHNWVFVGPNAKTLPALLVESRRISELRGGGMPPTTTADIYKPLAKAIEGMTIPGLHAGGPRAKVLSGEQEVATALCKRCMTRVASYARADEAKTLARLHKLMEQTSIKYEQLWPAANAVPYGTDGEKRAGDAAESAAVQAARAVLGCRYGSQKCIPFVTKALVRTVKDIGATEGADAAAAFVVELDELIMTFEFAAAYAKFIKTEPPTFERVLWRGADAKGFPGWWLVRLAPGSYGLLGKLGPRWTWTVADRDNTFATVPDAQFAVAVEVAMARDS